MTSPLVCSSPTCGETITRLLVEKEWKEGLVLQCPRCSVHLLPCECCGGVTRYSRSHALASGSAASGSGWSFDLAQCASCQFPSPLPSVTASRPCIRSALRLSSLFPWSRGRAWRFQLRLDAGAYVSRATQLYLARLDEFRALSARAGVDGSVTHSPSASQSSARGMGGAQGEESKSQESLLVPPSPPTGTPTPTHAPAPQATDAAAVEQQLLHAREQLLQCQTLREPLESGEEDGADAEDDEDTWRFDEHPLHDEFTATHLRIMETLGCVAPSHASDTSGTASATESVAPVGGVSVPPVTLGRLVRRFLDERDSILAGQAQVADAWRLLKSVAGSQVAVDNDQPGVTRSSSASGPAAAASSSGPAPAADASDHLATTTIKVLTNIFRMRFRREELLLQLRLEPFQQLLRDVGELLVHLYDATLSALSQQSHSRMPAALLAQVSAPPIAAGDEAHEEWRRMADQVRAIRHAQNTPSSYDHQTRPDLPVEVREATMQQLSLSDLQVCVEYARLLYGDVYHTIAPRVRHLRRTTQLPTQSHAAAAVHASPRPTRHDVDMCASPGASVAFPPAPFARSAPSAATASNAHRKHHTLSRSHTTGPPATHHANATPQRHHPYQRDR